VEIELLNLKNPEHTQMLENLIYNAMLKLHQQGLMTSPSETSEKADEKWTTEDVCTYFNVGADCVYKYIRNGLPRRRSKPNTYWKSEVIAWDREKRSSRKRKRK